MHARTRRIGAIGLVAIAIPAVAAGGYAVAAGQPTRSDLASAKNPVGGKGRTLGLTRVTIPAGAQLAAHTHPGTEIARIEHGTLTYTVERNGSVPVYRGDAGSARKLRTLRPGQTARLRARRLDRRAARNGPPCREQHGRARRHPAVEPVPERGAGVVAGVVARAGHGEGRAGRRPPATPARYGRSMTKLGSSDLDVFPLCLGGNVFGWTADARQSFAVLDAYAAAGGNFIDTADSYSAWVPGNTGGESEAIIGEWMAERGNRDRDRRRDEGRARTPAA